MRTTIDAAGRVVVPKSMRDAMGLAPGMPIDVVVADGRIEIEIAPVEVDLDLSDGLPRLRTPPNTTPLTDTEVRAVVESQRR